MVCPPWGAPKYVHISVVAFWGVLTPGLATVGNGTRRNPLSVLSYRLLPIAIGQSILFKIFAKNFHRPKRVRALPEVDLGRTSVVE